jgi:hypothetical protein
MTAMGIACSASELQTQPIQPLACLLSITGKYVTSIAAVGNAAGDTGTVTITFNNRTQTR